jgi:hypothetical protein
VDYARNSYHDEFIDFLPRFSSRYLSHFLMDLTITHMVLVHERVVLCLCRSGFTTLPPALLQEQSVVVHC